MTNLLKKTQNIYSNHIHGLWYDLLQFYVVEWRISKFMNFSFLVCTLFCFQIPMWRMNHLKNYLFYIVYYWWIFSASNSIFLLIYTIQRGWKCIGGMFLLYISSLIVSFGIISITLLCKGFALWFIRPFWIVIVDLSRWNVFLNQLKQYYD